MRRGGVPIFLLLAGALRVSGWAADVTPSEYQVKAAFLLNFTRFVEWPESAFPAPNAPINICVLGDDPFGQVLDGMVAGESVGVRRVVIQRIRRPSPKSCHVVFVGHSEKGWEKLVGPLGPGVLTVGEGDDFLREGGAIAFVLENRRVRFDVDQSAAADAGLKISSKLLSVARSVQK